MPLIKGGCLVALVPFTDLLPQRDGTSMSVGCCFYAVIAIRHMQLFHLVLGRESQRATHNREDTYEHLQA